MLYRGVFERVGWRAHLFTHDANLPVGERVLQQSRLQVPSGVLVALQPPSSSQAYLKSKLDYYLRHEDERVEIAAPGRARALREHTYEHRAREMLSVFRLA